MYIFLFLMLKSTTAGVVIFINIIFSKTIHTLRFVELAWVTHVKQTFPLYFTHIKNCGMSWTF